MNQKELVDKISDKSKSIDRKIKKKDIDLVIDLFRDTVKEVVDSGEEVKLHGFMEFSKKVTPERKGKSTITGEEIEWTSEPREQIHVKLSEVWRELE